MCSSESRRPRSRAGCRPRGRSTQRAVPSRAKSDSKVYSAVEPTFFRLYRVDQGMDVVKSVPAGIDRVQSYRFRSTVPELTRLFDGTEQLVAVSVIPWYAREVRLP